ncbi:MAG: hypothetical protein HC769_06855 [Cyanobacteria bacterium CRU_2_1]|nr:hypothetical protein [Cyanobacteria bacterium RU_5_0]NJR58594.1 hypothetical protein [Cyanobacteria bacterium CRU_2_1]
MELSTFELLVKPIAPRNGDLTIKAVARRVVQGYFLTISNLESVDLTFNLDFFISIPDSADANRSLRDNAVLIYDIAGNNNFIPLIEIVTDRQFSGSFVLPAGQTASVELLPNATLFTNADPMFEVRGYVSLTLPALFNFETFRFEPQRKMPVQVLLNPEIRGTFLPNGYPQDLGGDFDQINYSLAIASGKALNEIKPEKGFPIWFELFNPDVLNDLRTKLEFRLQNASPLAKAQALAELSAKASTTSSNAQNFGELITNLTIPG